MYIPIITGPTAVGKTSTTIELANQIGGEIVVADKYQMVRGFDIGSAKPSRKEQSKVNYHLIDELYPYDILTMGQFFSKATNAIANIKTKRKYPIVEGGNIGYVSKLSKKGHKHPELANDEFKIFGFIREREELYLRVQNRLSAMLENGMIEEVKDLIAEGHGNTSAFKMGIGYKEVAAYLTKQISFRQMYDILVDNTMNLIHDQLEFLERKSGVKKINLSKRNNIDEIVEEIIFDIKAEPIQGNFEF